jgi:hypothetical protein
MRHVALTVDYEVFGNGAGDVRQHMVEPTERMARICEKYDAPLMVFVEMEETLAFQRHATDLHRQLGYNPYDLIRKQIADLAKRGHDIQLHLHPEWVGTQLVNGAWQLNERHATVDSLFETQEETTAYLRDRKEALEELISDAGPGKSVCAYRAGAFSAQPGNKLLRALAENDFVLDTSVVHGLHRHDENVHLDYRNAPRSRAMWRVDKDVAVADASGPLWEVPIGSKPGRRLHQLTWGRLKAKFSTNIPKAQQTRLVKQLGVRRNPFKLARFLTQPVPLKFDFHNVAPAKLVRWIQDLPAPAPGELDVVVLIGHSKEHIDDVGFERIVRGIKKSGMQIVGLEKIARELSKKSSPPTRSSLVPASRVSMV